MAACHQDENFLLHCSPDRQQHTHTLHRAHPCASVNGADISTSPTLQPSGPSDVATTCCDIVTWALGIFWCRCACGCRRRHPAPVVLPDVVLAEEVTPPTPPPAAPAQQLPQPQPRQPPYLKVRRRQTHRKWGTDANLRRQP